MVKATRWRARLRAISSDGERAKRAIRSGGGGGQPVGTRRHPRVTSLFRSSLPTRRQPRTKKILVTNIK